MLYYQRLVLPLAAALALLIAACGGGTDPAKELAEGKRLGQQGDFPTAIVHLKNVLKATPDNGEARYLLGAAYNALRDGKTAESELRRAQSLGYVGGGRVAAELGRALLSNREPDKLLKEVNPTLGFEDGEVAAIHALRGRAHLAKGALDDAEKEFSLALKLQPESPEALIGQAAMQLVKRDDSGALATVDRVLAKHPGHFDALLFKGDLLRAKSQLEAALAAYDQATKVLPREFSARYGKATLLVEMNKLDAAQAEIDVLRKVARGNPFVTYLQGLVHFRRGKYREALEAVQQAQRGAPDYAPLLLLSGAANYSLGSFGQAEKDLTQFLKIYPNNLHARKLLVATLNEMDQGKRALEVIEPGLARDTQDSMLLGLLGTAEMRSGDYGKALSYWEKAAQNAPENADARTRLGLGRLAIGDTERAIKDLEAAADMDPKVGKSGLILAVTLLNNRQYDRAIEAGRALEKKQPKNPVVQNLLGIAYIGKGDRANARKSFEQTLVLAPTYMQAVANLAALDLQDGKPREARQRFEKVLSADKNNLKALLALAGIEARDKQNAKSIEYLQRAVKAHPEAMDARALLIGRYLSAGDTAQAVKTAEEANRSTGGKPEALEILGRTQMIARNYTEAVAAFEKLAATVPNAPGAHYLLAVARVAAKAPNAEAEFRKALQLDPNHIPAAANLALLLARSGKEQAALKVAQDMQATNPKSAAGHVLQGDVLMETKQHAKAARAYEAALKVQADQAVAIKVYMAESLAGNPKGGIAFLEKWTVKHPSDFEVRRYLAEGLILVGRYQDAVLQYLDILGQGQKDALAMNNLAMLYHELKDPRALQTAEGALKLEPDNPLFADTVAYVLIGQGKNAEALPLLQKAAARVPESPTIRYHLALALANTGDKAKAREEVDKALATTVPFSERKQATELRKRL